MGEARLAATFEVTGRNVDTASLISYGVDATSAQVNMQPLPWSADTDYEDGTHLFLLSAVSGTQNPNSSITVTVRSGDVVLGSQTVSGPLAVAATQGLLPRE